MRSTSWFLSLALLAGAADPGGVDDKNDLNPLQGSYAMFLCFTSGERLSADLVKSGELVVEDNEYRPRLGASVTATTITVDSTKTPHSIDFSYTAGPQKGQTLKGIYKIDGNNLTICRGLIEQANRPTEFAAPVDTNLSLVIWKRAKTPISSKVKAIEQDRQQFEGKWRFVSVEVEGKPIPAKAFEDGLLTLKGKPSSSVRSWEIQLTVFTRSTRYRPPRLSTSLSANGPGKDKTERVSTSWKETSRRFALRKGTKSGRLNSRVSPAAGK